MPPSLAATSITRRISFAFRQPTFATGLASFAIFLAIALFARDSAAQSPYPTFQSNVPRIIGRWTGKTEEDGILTLVVFPAPGRELTYEFSGGQKEHGEGTFTLRGANELNFTPKGEKEPEKWTYSFDEQGRLHLKMEEDKPEDEEEYILSRAGQ
ncbi:MAG TPA: hypothetical protein VKB78_13055 [Pirellulales bacterium]|nr:hypothetical protein [Pirellulales bacterium]